MEKGKKKKKNYFQSHTTPSKLLPLKQKATSIETGGGGISCKDEITSNISNYDQENWPCFMVEIITNFTWTLGQGKSHHFKCRLLKLGKLVGATQASFTSR